MVCHSKSFKNYIIYHCGYHGHTVLKKADRPTRLGFPVWAPNFFYYLIREKGFFEKNNVAVEFTLIPNSVPILNNYSNEGFDGQICLLIYGWQSAVSYV